MNSYLQGTLVEETFTVKSSAGTVVTPTGLQVVVTTPSGASTTYTYGSSPQLTFDAATQEFTLQLDTTSAAGVWYWVCTTAGDQAVAEGSFLVEAVA
jgi:hypothetical protein